MNATKQSLWALFTLVILACSGWYFANFKTDIRLDNNTLSTTVDTTISNLTVRKFNPEGMLINLLTTPLMRHIPEGDVHLLQTPHIVITQKNESPWDIRSIKAKSFEGGKRITFMEHVIVHQQSGETSQGSTMTTEEVTYYPNEKKATTDLPVVYEQSGNRIQSTGMIAHLDEKRVELLHQAKGIYDPSKG